MGVEWTLDFDIPARTRAADARRQASQVQVAAVEQDIRAEIHVALAEVKSARGQMVAAERQVAAAQAALELVEARHQEGAALLVEVLQAQQSLIEARIALVRGICQQNRAQLELRRLVGGV